MIEQTRQPGSAPPLPIIGLAGGIAAGKSEAGEILRTLGCLVTRSDAVVRTILESNPAVRKQLLAWWGEKILTPEGKVSRSAIAALVFQDADERKRLEELLHPLVEQERKDTWARECAEASATGRVIKGLVIDAPLLFEAGLAEICQAVIFIAADPEIRLARVQATRGWDAEELERRENTQWYLERKRKRADYVIENNGSADELRKKIENVLTTIIANNTPA